MQCVELTKEPRLEPAHTYKVKAGYPQLRIERTKVRNSALLIILARWQSLP